MSEPTKIRSASDSKSRKRLPFGKLVILYFIAGPGSYDSSILQMSRDMGYASDSTVNKNLNELVRDGYVTAGPRYALTRPGEMQLSFSRLPDAFVSFLLAVAFVEVALALVSLAGFGPINSLSSFALGVAALILCIMFFKVKKRTFDDFLGVRKPLLPTESTPREDRDPNSIG